MLYLPQLMAALAALAAGALAAHEACVCERGLPNYSMYYSIIAVDLGPGASPAQCQAACEATENCNYGELNFFGDCYLPHLEYLRDGMKSYTYYTGIALGSCESFGLGQGSNSGCETISAPSSPTRRARRRQLEEEGHHQASHAAGVY